MSAAENAPATSGGIVRDYDVLEHDLRLGIGLAEARAQRLIGEIFVYPHLAEQAFRKLSRRRGFAHAIAVFEETVLRRELTFGVFRTGFLGWRRRAVAAAIGELPEALRDLKHLNERLGDVRQARSHLAQQHRPPAPEREIRIQTRTQARSR